MADEAEDSNDRAEASCSATERAAEELERLVDEDMDPDYVLPPPKQKRSSDRLKNKDRWDFNFYRKERNEPRIKQEREKRNFYNAIKQFGSKDYKEVAKTMPGKTEENIKRWISREKRNQAYRTEQRVIKPDGTSLMMSDIVKGAAEGKIEEDLNTPGQREGLEIEDVLKKQESYAPIDKWIGIIEDNKEKEKNKLEAEGKEKSYEFEKTIPMSLRLIAEFEKHPEPEDCGGIDYAAIYRYFASLCEGEVPADLNPESAARVTRLISDISLMVKNEGDSNTSAAQKEILEREDVYMENYRGPFTRFRSSDNFDQKSQTAQKMGELASVPGLNPLNFPLEVFCNRQLDLSKLAVKVRSPPEEDET